MSKDIQDEYDKLIKWDIENLVAEVAEFLEGKEERTLLKGWRVFFSPLIHKPKVLFIGINPGNGQEDVVDLKYFNDDAKLEYIEYENERGVYIESPYSLAKETKEVFSISNLSEILHMSSVKINFFFLSTTSLKDLYKLTDFLGRGENGLGEKLFKKSAVWTKHLIELIEPELVICEGKEAFKNVYDLFQKPGTVPWTNGCGYGKVKLIDKDLIILGYSRRFSRIRNKEELSKLLIKFLPKNPT